MSGRHAARTYESGVAADVGVPFGVEAGSTVTVLTGVPVGVQVAVGHGVQVGGTVGVGLLGICDSTGPSRLMIKLSATRAENT